MQTPAQQVLAAAPHREHAPLERDAEKGALGAAVGVGGARPRQRRRAHLRQRTPQAHAQTSGARHRRVISAARSAHGLCSPPSFPALPSPPPVGPPGGRTMTEASAVRPSGPSAMPTLPPRPTCTMPQQARTASGVRSTSSRSVSSPPTCSATATGQRTCAPHHATSNQVRRAEEGRHQAPATQAKARPLEKTAQALRAPSPSPPTRTCRPQPSPASATAQGADHCPAELRATTSPAPPPQQQQQQQPGCSARHTPVPLRNHPSTTARPCHPLAARALYLCQRWRSSRRPP